MKDLLRDTHRSDTLFKEHNGILADFSRQRMTEDTLKKLIPVKRLGTPDDIANVVLFLCGPAAAYVTGQVITVDGGLSLGAVSG